MYSGVVRRVKPVSVPDEAKRIVMGVVDKKKYPTIKTEDLFIIWSSKTLDNWKAQVSAPFEDFPLYEVTHSGLKNETYIDMYVKKRNYIVKGEN